jgi:hypothetical protein
MSQSIYYNDKIERKRKEKTCSVLIPFPQNGEGGKCGVLGV